MREFGYFRVAAGVPVVKPGDVKTNIKSIISLCRKALKEEVEMLVLPELSVCGYTCGDLFGMPILLNRSLGALDEITGVTRGNGLCCVVGCPVESEGKVYNCGAVVAGGEVRGVVPKIHLPNYSEFYEKRWFASGKGIKSNNIEVNGKTVPFGTDLLFDINGVKAGVEICEDLWVPVPPSSKMAVAGAEVICNLSASDELTGKNSYLLELLSQQSARCRCAYVYSSAGWGESSTDLVFAGKAIISENGKVMSYPERMPMEEIMLVKDVDIEKIGNERRRSNSFGDDAESYSEEYRIVKIRKPEYDLRDKENPRIEIDKYPFVPGEDAKLYKHCSEIVDIQSRGLMQRLNAIGCKRAVIGISGGLDSTLALLVTVRAFDRLGLNRKGITGITMPGKATTSRTRNNAVSMMDELGVTSVEIPIGEAVDQHFKDIGQDAHNYDVTFENSQARERTQILMDYANKENAIVIGTGDMSELALGWCTYNGDHMSMYGVNSSVPKTLVRHLVKWFARELDGKVSSTLLDVVDTPISPELVPADGDKIGQITEDLVGPYELHDFFMYNFLRNCFSPRKIFMLARKAFGSEYDDTTILKWLGTFFRRFFSQQFKRSCMPDGPKVGSVTLSPRGDWRMPSDASSALWLEEVSQLEKGIEEVRQ